MADPVVGGGGGGGEGAGGEGRREGGAGIEREGAPEIAVGGVEVLDIDVDLKNKD